ncbi:protein SanA [Capnocytophaga canis]|uniref:Protein SanA n=2 Tax=Capnocytophaga canis TaxID=1848903 RepID=A0A3A1YDC3_9FLAO|nr:protein SanA [Capnocytophaga canis]
MKKTFSTYFSSFKIKKVLEWVVFSALLLFLGILMCNTTIVKRTKNMTYNNLYEIPHNKVGLVLGTIPKLSNGAENPYFTYRIDATLALFEAKKIDYVLVSGDNNNSNYNEPQAFKEALIERGIPEERIFLDYAGFRTLDSVVRAKIIFGQEKITIISQKFHNERAIYIALKNNIDAIGFNAKDLPTHLGFKTQIREYLARTKLFIDLLFGVTPKFLGEKIEIP